MDNPQFHRELIISITMIAATTFLHGVFIAASASVFRLLHAKSHGFLRFLRDTIVLVILGLWLIAAHLLSIAMWAAVFLRYELFKDIETALYYSASSYTTLGASDVVLSEGWRLLAGATAANGFLLFGLSAAFLFEAAGRMNLAGDRR